MYKMGVSGNLWKVVVLWGLLEHWLVCLGQGRHILPVLWIMPFTDEPGRGNITEATLPAVHLAQQHLRKQAAPICNYELEFHFVNTQVICHFLLLFLFPCQVLLVQSTWGASVCVWAPPLAACLDGLERVGHCLLSVGLLLFMCIFIQRDGRSVLNAKGATKIKINNKIT